MGAVSFHIDHFVKGRISKFTYGVPCAVLYRPFDSEHSKREHKTITDVLGDKYLPCAFETMLSKVCHRSVRIQLILLTDRLGFQGSRKPRNSNVDVRCSRRSTSEGCTGANRKVRWYPEGTAVDRHRAKYGFQLIGIIPVAGAHNPKDRFETLCHVAADVSGAPSTLKIGRSGKVCYHREYEVVLLVGLTELKAQIRWTDSTTVRI